MQLHTLQSIHTKKTARRVGRGGKRGKTSGRGTKGQKARAGHKIRPEARDLIKKLPKRRGYGKNRSRTVRRVRPRYHVINLSKIEENFSAGEKVTPETLLQKGLIKSLRGSAGVKILGTGTLSKAVTISRCTVSTSAARAVEAAGGVLTHA